MNKQQRNAVKDFGGRFVMMEVAAVNAEVQDALELKFSQNIVNVTLRNLVMTQKMLQMIP